MSRTDAPRRDFNLSTTARAARFARGFLLALLALSSFATGGRDFACAQTNPRPPAQREIDTQQARLASTVMEERRDAVTRLGAMARPDAARAAAAGLKDAAPIVRATAARAVLSLPAEEAARLLLPLLDDKQEFVRRETAYALGLTRSASAVEGLVMALARDKEAGVRGAAAVALGQIGDARAVPALSEALGRRIRASGILSRVTFRKTEENEFVRRAAAISLGQIRSREGVPALVAALSNERVGDDVRREAARALGEIGDATASPALRAALTARDPYLSEIAAESLRKLDPNNATRSAPKTSN
ncbi:MAG: HEAT repeat domain-containing protein [Pyrinomonadaceae bacterium]